MLGLVIFSELLESFSADLATEREHQLTTVRPNQTTGLTNGRATNWAPVVVFIPFRALPVVNWRSLPVAKSAFWFEDEDGYKLDI